MHIERPQSKQPMPAEAKLMFKGVMFEVYQWQQKSFDGSEKIYEKVRRPDTVIAIGVTPGGQIITTTQEQPSIDGTYYALASGHIDAGEDPLTAAKRELLEETGYASEQWELFYAYQPSTKIDYALYCFIARNCKKAAEQHLDSGEKITVKEISFEDFLELVLDPDFIEGGLRYRVLEAKLYPEKMLEFKKAILG